MLFVYVLFRDGFTYERLAIEKWFSQSRDSAVRSPMTNLPLESLALEPDADLKSQIHRFRTENEATASGICEASTASGVLNEFDPDFNMINLNEENPE